MVEFCFVFQIGLDKERGLMMNDSFSSVLREKGVKTFGIKLSNTLLNNFKLDYMAFFVLSRRCEFCSFFG